MPNYKYRVYNVMTGYEYGDVDSYETANALRWALYPSPASNLIAIDLLVSARDDA
jgi:hypothetical protein